MRTFLKIIATLFFILFWGQLGRGCIEGAKSTGSGAGVAIMNLFNLILLFGGLYGIWKFNPDKKNNESNDMTLNKD